MTYASLTPLGRRLRSVIVRLGGGSTPTPSADKLLRSGASLQSAPSGKPPSRALHVSSAKRSAAAAAVLETQTADEGVEPHNAIEGEDRGRRKVMDMRKEISRRRLNRRTRVDRISEALLSTRQGSVAPRKIDRKGDLSYRNAASKEGRATARENLRRHRNDSIPTLDHTRESTLELILAKYIKHQANVQDVGQADWMAHAALRPSEIHVLEDRGFTLDHVREWATIVSASDSLEAAKRLARYSDSTNDQPIPLSILLYLLRRPYISARALRIIVQQAEKTLDQHLSKSRAHVPENSIFIIFSRLLRHAREVWPSGIEDLSNLLLDSLSRAAFSRARSVAERIHQLTYMLNKAMLLLATPTAFEPFKNNQFQEVGIVKILRFMNEHEPPLQTNREGYRAVVLLQLAQHKRPKEQQWAELKALSWPPWKADRTAMDSDITVNDHGTSKAAETLAQMRAAGYAWTGWEKVASTFAGWDSDGTPTTQTLVHMGSGGPRFRDVAVLWAARIATTRTAQEAWACYLAYEDKKLPSSQLVYLAVFEKLHKEDERQRKASIAKVSKRHGSPSYMRVYPGDSREIEPLPPSIHLYTYTRTPPPNVDAFYTHLVDRGMKLHGHCLAFVIANAESLEIGLKYLHHGSEHYRNLTNLLHPTRLHDLTGIPTSIITAFIGLLTRSSNVTLALDPAEMHANATIGLRPMVYHHASRHRKHRLNWNHTIVRALDLLAVQCPLMLPMWNAVLVSLAKENTMDKINSAVLHSAEQSPEGQISLEQKHFRGALAAYRIMVLVLRMMKKLSLDPDTVAFQAQCQCIENVVVTSWICARSEEQHPPAYSSGNAMSPNMDAATGWFDTNPAKRLKAAFEIVVGDDEMNDEEPGSHFQNQKHKSPVSLEIPSPAVLHSYIRALGWVADYDGLLGIVEWMSNHQEELARRIRRERNGRATMRRAIVAVRVFLERSWLEFGAIDESMTLQDGAIQYRDDPTRGFLNSVEAAPSETTVDQIRTMIESVEGWGGWPEDDEVEDYCQHDRFQKFG